MLIALSFVKPSGTLFQPGGSWRATLCVTVTLLVFLLIEDDMLWRGVITVTVEPLSVLMLRRVNLRWFCLEATSASQSLLSIKGLIVLVKAFSPGNVVMGICIERYMSTLVLKFFMSYPNFYAIIRALLSTDSFVILAGVGLDRLLSIKFCKISSFRVTL